MQQHIGKLCELGVVVKVAVRVKVMVWIKDADVVSVVGEARQA